MVDEIAPGVYDVTVLSDGDARYRVFVFDGESPTLVDTGLADTTDTLFTELEDLGIVPERVIITHGDGDHIGGLPAVVDHYDVETWVPEKTDVPAGVEPDYRYGDGDVIGQFTAVHIPGHTANHHSLVDENSGVAVLGDALFGSDARGLPKDHFVLPPAFYSENLNDADENLAALLEYDFEVGLVYHGSSVRTGASEKIRQFVDFRGKP